jgi:transcriptional regulator with XRE-family HTH domain
MAEREKLIAQDFASRLVLARVTAGIRTVGEMANILGVSESDYQDYENGAAQPTLVQLYDISRTTGASLDSLILGESTVAPKDDYARLTQIDFASIRAIREWIITQGATSPRLKVLDEEATTLRDKSDEDSAHKFPRL